MQQPISTDEETKKDIIKSLKDLYEQLANDSFSCCLPNGCQMSRGKLDPDGYDYLGSEMAIHNCICKHKILKKDNTTMNVISTLDGQDALPYGAKRNYDDAVETVMHHHCTMDPNQNESNGFISVCPMRCCKTILMKENSDDCQNCNERYHEQEELFQTCKPCGKSIHKNRVSHMVREDELGQLEDVYLLKMNSLEEKFNNLNNQFYKVVQIIDTISKKLDQYQLDLTTLITSNEEIKLKIKNLEQRLNCANEEQYDIVTTISNIMTKLSSITECAQALKEMEEIKKSDNKETQHTYDDSIKTPFRRNLSGKNGENKQGNNTQQTKQQEDNEKGKKITSFGIQKNNIGQNGTMKTKYPSYLRQPLKLKKNVILNKNKEKLASNTKPKGHISVPEKHLKLKNTIYKTLNSDKNQDLKNKETNISTRAEKLTLKSKRPFPTSPTGTKCLLEIDDKHDKSVEQINAKLSESVKPTNTTVYNKTLNSSKKCRTPIEEGKITKVTEGSTKSKLKINTLTPFNSICTESLQKNNCKCLCEKKLNTHEQEKTLINGSTEAGDSNITKILESSQECQDTKKEDRNILTITNTSCSEMKPSFNLNGTECIHKIDCKCFKKHDSYECIDELLSETVKSPITINSTKTLNSTQIGQESIEENKNGSQVVVSSLCTNKLNTDGQQNVLQIVSTKAGDTNEITKILDSSQKCHDSQEFEKGNISEVTKSSNSKMKSEVPNTSNSTDTERIRKINYNCLCTKMQTNDKTIYLLNEHVKEEKTDEIAEISDCSQKFQEENFVLTTAETMKLKPEVTDLSYNEIIFKTKICCCCKCMNEELELQGNVKDYEEKHKISDSAKKCQDINVKKATISSCTQNGFNSEKNSQSSISGNTKLIKKSSSKFNCVTHENALSTKHLKKSGSHENINQKDFTVRTFGQNIKQKYNGKISNIKITKFENVFSSQPRHFAKVKLKPSLKRMNVKNSHVEQSKKRKKNISLNYASTSFQNSDPVGKKHQISSNEEHLYQKQDKYNCPSAKQSQFCQIQDPVAAICESNSYIQTVHLFKLDSAEKGN